MGNNVIAYLARHGAPPVSSGIRVIKRSTAGAASVIQTMEGQNADGAGDGKKGWVCRVFTLMRFSKAAI
jgi:hypothetical protein